MPMNAWTAAWALLSLGALHGLNPGMGWLFAVALGMQHGDRRAVWRALGPLALGHALAIAAAVGIAMGLGLRASGRELTVWSFVVATAHGAGLMAAPFALRAADAGASAHSDHAGHSMASLANVASIDWPTLWATGVHTAGYLLVTAVLAVMVYERASIHVVRRAWINFDLVWAGALMLTGCAVVLL